MRPPTAAERLHLVLMNFKSDRTASYSTSIPTLSRAIHGKLTQVYYLLPCAGHALRGASRRALLARARRGVAGNRLQIWLLSNCNLGRSIAFIEMFDYEPLAKVQYPHVSAILPT